MERIQGAADLILRRHEEGTWKQLLLFLGSPSAIFKLDVGQSVDMLVSGTTIF